MCASKPWSISSVYFGRFFGRHKFLGVGIVKIAPILSPLPRVASTEKSHVRILPLARKLLNLTGLILGPMFNFHDYFFLGANPVPVGVCAR